MSHDRHESVTQKENINQNKNETAFSYLPPEKQPPLAVPNVEQATRIGMLQAMTPYKRFAKVC